MRKLIIQLFEYINNPWVNREEIHGSREVKKKFELNKNEEKELPPDL